MATPPPDRARFELAYQPNTTDPGPWDIPRPQPALVEIVDQITGRILDSGCGTGENALFFASLGREVVGIDFVEAAIKQAKERAAGRGIAVTFLVKDALTLAEWDERFDNVIDSAVFHVFSDEQVRTYVDGLAHVLKSGGRLFLIVFSDAEPGEHGPRRISRAMLEAAFATGWVIESITPTQYEVLPQFDGSYLSKGGARAWLAIMRRI